MDKEQEKINQRRLYNSKDNRTRHRYDKETGYWISKRKRIYNEWYRTLRHTIKEPSLSVDFSKYKGWGGHNVIIGVPFDVWWKERWVNLFGVKDKSGGKKPPFNKKPKFTISKEKVIYDSERVRRLTWELRNKGTHKEIAEMIKNKELGRKGISLIEYWLMNDEGRELEIYISKWKRDYKKTMKNVSMGIYP